MPDVEVISKEEGLKAIGIKRNVRSLKRSRNSLLDMTKFLEEKRSKLETGILKLTGASNLAEEQLKLICERGFCPMCNSELNSYPISLTSCAKKTILACKLTREKQLSMHKECIDDLEELTGKNWPANRMHSDVWCLSEMRKGRIAILREQKIQSLTSGECVTCGKNIKNIAAFLQSIDRQIYQLDSGFENLPPLQETCIL